MRTILLLLLLTLLSCEKEECDIHSSYYWGVIEKGTCDNPVWLREPILRKKGSPRKFYPDQDNIPYLYDHITISSENLDEENAELVMVEVNVMKVLE